MARGLKRKLKKTAVTVLSMALLIIVVVALFGYVIPACKDVNSLGAGIGDNAGKMVGKVIGSFEGITKGLSSGAEAGKDEGLSAKDTLIEMKNNFEEVSNLEVLEAGVKLTDVNKIGDDYISLLVIKGVAIYSVDLKMAEIKETGTDSIEILLPDVNVEVFIDDKGTEKLAEYQKHSWSGKSSDGFTEYINSVAAIDENATKTMKDNMSLLEAAEASAKKQVTNIAKAATGNNKEISVNFINEVQDNE